MEENKVKCARCGFAWIVAQHKRERKDLLCVSCRARKANVVIYGPERCIPWHGDFDDNDNPMHDGSPFMPGQRTCGHRDCCNPHHVVGGFQ